MPCEVVARMGGAYDNGSAPFYYDIIANPMETGTYATWRCCEAHTKGGVFTDFEAVVSCTESWWR